MKVIKIKEDEMSSVKKALLKEYGNKCMMCQKKFPLRLLQRHHIKPRYVFKQNGEQVDNTKENSSILCVSCHTMIHEYLWEDDEYQLLTEIILKTKTSP